MRIEEFLPNANSLPLSPSIWLAKLCNVIYCPLSSSPSFPLPSRVRRLPMATSASPSLYLHPLLRSVFPRLFLARSHTFAIVHAITLLIKNDEKAIVVEIYVKRRRRVTAKGFNQLTSNENSIRKTSLRFISSSLLSPPAATFRTPPFSPAFVWRRPCI